MWVKLNDEEKKDQRVRKMNLCHWRSFKSDRFFLANQLVYVKITATVTASDVKIDSQCK